MLPVTAANAVTDDIRGHWAESVITELTEKGIVPVMPDGSFPPDTTISRAEFTSMMVKAFHLDKTNGRVFKDTEQHWAKDYIAIANAYGIVSGYGADYFGPDDPITREQMAAIIVNAAALEKKDTALNFTDNDKVSAWAKNVVAVAAAYRIIGGFPDGSFKPRDNATHAQAAVVVSKTLKNSVRIYEQAGTYGPAEGQEAVFGSIIARRREPLCKTPSYMGI
jgi:hypothetical protein